VKVNVFIAVLEEVTVFINILVWEYASCV